MCVHNKTSTAYNVAIIILGVLYICIMNTRSSSRNVLIKWNEYSKTAWQYYETKYRYFKTIWQLDNRNRLVFMTGTENWRRPNKRFNRSIHITSLSPSFILTQSFHISNKVFYFDCGRHSSSRLSFVFFWPCSFYKFACIHSCKIISHLISPLSLPVSMHSIPNCFLCSSDSSISAIHITCNFDIHPVNCGSFYSAPVCQYKFFVW